MIDAITEGRPFELDVPVPVGEDALNLKFNSDEISILGSRGFATAVRNPRNACEIAAALIAWANRKDGRAGEPNPIADRMWVESIVKNREDHS